MGQGTAGLEIPSQGGCGQRCHRENRAGRDLEVFPAQFLCCSGQWQVPGPADVPKNPSQGTSHVPEGSETGPSGVSPSVTLEMLSLPPPLEFSTFPSWDFTRPEAPESSQQSRMLCLGSCCASGVYLDVVRRIVITFLRGKPSQILSAQDLGPLHNCWVYTQILGVSPCPLLSPPVPPALPRGTKFHRPGKCNVGSGAAAAAPLLVFLLSRKRRGIGDYCACI